MSEISEIKPREGAAKNGNHRYRGRAMLPQPHARVLVHLAFFLREFTWALGGSGALALHGIPIEPDDLDICTDRASAYRMEASLDAPILQPVELRTSDLIRSHLGVVQMDDVAVEIIGDMEIRTADGAWPGAPDVGKNCGMLEFGGDLIPVMDLQFLRDGYQRLGRMDRVRQIEQYLFRAVSFTTTAADASA